MSWSPIVALKKSIKLKADRGEILQGCGMVTWVSKLRAVIFLYVKTLTVGGDGVSDLQNKNYSSFFWS